MIRRFLPAFALIAVAWVCVLAAVGALAGAAAVWLSTYWGMGWALLAVSLGFILLALLSLAVSKLWMRLATRHAADPVTDTLEGIWKAHPAALLAVGALVVFVLARKPGIIGRLFSAAAKSTGAVTLLRRFL